MIKIKNLRVEKPSKPYDVRVDRTSVLGNPFYMANESMREEVCRKYSQYAKEQYLWNDKYRQEILRLVKLFKKYGQLNLYCWCYPKQCHAESIRRAVIYIAQNSK